MDFVCGSGESFTMDKADEVCSLKDLCMNQPLFEDVSFQVGFSCILAIDKLQTTNLTNLVIYENAYRKLPLCLAWSQESSLCNWKLQAGHSSH